MEGVGPAYVPGSAAAGREIAPRSPSETKAEHRGHLLSWGGVCPEALRTGVQTRSRVQAPGSAMRTAERAETTRRASADRQPEATGAAHRGRHSVSNARSPGKTPRPDGQTPSARRRREAASRRAASA